MRPRPLQEKRKVANGSAAADVLGKRPLNWRATRSARTPAGSVAWGVMGGVRPSRAGGAGRRPGRARRTAVEHEPEVGVRGDLVTHEEAQLRLARHHALAPQHEPPCRRRPRHLPDQEVVDAVTRAHGQPDEERTLQQPEEALVRARRLLRHLLQPLERGRAVQGLDQVVLPGRHGEGRTDGRGALRARRKWTRRGRGFSLLSRRRVERREWNRLPAQTI